ncbi:DNA polymerase III subunit gamma/tau [Borrelia hermsii]|uniref:DNA polymerase III subunit gamma/tau n=3 Tax=Borrelia hermsii TaxID=140 RepID=A0AAN1CES3_BORHE|nr:DNA polymerase III subunit gamma/tau [Borrelia hermsii]AAX16969.1 DNA polymerase III subunit gamma/tau [Borrelia hermsii DAH]AJW73262.1 DNA polymerase III subunits gamma and tau [Borrelia hermsii CC1]AMR75384.1 DNA polymerase III subunit gamma/tau / Recombinational Repair RER [Borrelia hermsii]ANA43267.1 DNA polymerase III subunit gamma/tau [Borrelia hermsii HS1]UCP01474.1 DNA polymerase III subunit gamma/tau [Borrelia hermsii]
MISARGTAIKRRPRDFNSLEGQDFVVETLKHSIENNRIANAYIFSGPRGVGKTSSARAFARCLNCQAGPTIMPCGVCFSCKSIDNDNSLDIIEIDGASNTSVQDVRQIKEEIMFPPASSKYRVYIIDEVHMLSNSAFNALLKTIEEPPSYIVFIFATTEVHKLPDTIKSRCQHFNFRLLPLEKIYEMLKHVCLEDNIKYEDEALRWIAYKSGGSVRDAYTLFDQIVSLSNSDINFEQIKSKMGLTSDEFLEKLALSILNDDLKELLCVLDAVFLTGISCEQFLLDAIEFFREILFLKLDIKNLMFIGIKLKSLKEKLSSFDLNHVERSISVLLETYRNLQFSVSPKYELEISFIKILRLKDYVPSHFLIKQIQDIEAKVLDEVSFDVNDVDVDTDLKSELGNIPSVDPVKLGLSKIDTALKTEVKDSRRIDFADGDDIDEIFIETKDSFDKVDDNDKIKESFIYLVSKYVQTLVYSGEVLIDNGVLYYKIFSGFEYNQLQAYQNEIRAEFCKEFPRLNVIFQKQFKDNDDEFDNEVLKIKNIFGASEVKD